MRQFLGVLNFFIGYLLIVAAFIGGVGSSVFVTQGRSYLTILFAVLYIGISCLGGILGIALGYGISQKGGWFEKTEPTLFSLAAYLLGLMFLLAGAGFLVWILEPVSMGNNETGIAVGLAGFGLVMAGIAAVKGVLRLRFLHLEAWCEQWRS